MSDRQARIELVIDELLLHGFPPTQRQHIGDALEQELTRLFQERGVPPALMQNSALPHIDGGAFQAAAQASPTTIGRQVARTLYSGLTTTVGQQQRAEIDGQRRGEQSTSRQHSSGTNEGGRR